MKNKLLILGTTSLLLLTSCNKKPPIEENYLKADIKFDKCSLNLKVYAYVEFHQFKYKNIDISNNEIINKSLELYKKVASSTYEYKDITEIDGFEGCDYYIFNFKGDTTTQLYINTENKYEVGLNGLDNNNNIKFFMYKDINETPVGQFDDSIKKLIDELKSTSKEKLDSTEWVLG